MIKYLLQGLVVVVGVICFIALFFGVLYAVLFMLEWAMKSLTNSILLFSGCVVFCSVVAWLGEKYNNRNNEECDWSDCGVINADTGIDH